MTVICSAFTLHADPCQVASPPRDSPITAMTIKVLPNEILIQIFRALRDMHVDAHSHHWIIVSHICQDWRLIALDAAELWTQIYSLDADCVRTFVQRSQQAPLDIDYTPVTSRAENVNVIEIINTQIHRLRSVQIGSLHMAYPFLMQPFTHGAPLLRSLELRCVWTSFIGKTLPAFSPSLPEICCQGLPALRRLYLTSWPVRDIASIRDLVSPMLRSLTILSPCLRHPLSAWVAILTELPLLKELHLNGVLLPAQPTLNSGYPEVVFIRLPNLTYLNIEDSNDDATDQISLLRQIIPSTNLHLTFRHLSMDMSPLSTATIGAQCLEAVSEKFKEKVVHPGFLHLELSMHSLGGIVARLVTSADEITSHDCPGYEPFDAPSSTILELSFDGPGYLYSGITISNRICDTLSSAFPLSKLSTLRLHSYFELDQWITALPGACKTPLFDSIRVLAIRSARTEIDLFKILSVFAAQSPAGDGSPTEVSWPVSFPALEVLTIEVPDRYTLVDWERLRLVLSSRGGAKHPFSRVHICRTLNISENSEKLTTSLSPLASLDYQVDYCTLKRGENREREIHSIQ